jgi:peptide methionine sulfoxide reductase MsrA
MLPKIIIKITMITIKMHPTFRDFYVAEDYHKNYYDNNQDAPYCNFIIDPKVCKLLLKYGNDVKEEYQNE